MVDIVTRAGKGSELSHEELDGNFTNLASAIEQVAAAAVGGLFPTAFVQDPVTLDLTITFSDGSVIGPVKLPTRTVRVRGAWARGELYDVADVLRHEGSSFIVAQGHLAEDFATDLAAGRLQLLAERGTDSAVLEAPKNGQPYVRRDGAWIVLPGDEGAGMRDRGGWSHQTATGPELDRYMRFDIVTHEGKLWIALVDEAGAEPYGDTVIRPGGLFSDESWLCITPFSGTGDAVLARSEFLARRLFVGSVSEPGEIRPLPEVLDELKGAIESGVGSDAPDDGEIYARQSGFWVEVPQAGIPDAESNGRSFVRKDGAWVEAPFVAEAPKDGKSYVRKDGSWVEAASGSGMFRDRGDYAAATASGPTANRYKKGDVVLFEGRHWFAIAENMTSIPRHSHPSYLHWRCLTPVSSDALFQPAETIDDLIFARRQAGTIGSLKVVLDELRARIKTLEDAA